MTDVVLQTRSLTKRFGSRTAVHDCNLEVYEGDIFGFLGPNGAGKSTTIRMALTLIRPTGGDVFIFGENVRVKRDVLQRVGALVEKPDFYNYLSGRKNLETVAALYGGVASGRIDEVLEMVGLLERGHDKVKAYSHGMKQRLGIAQALLSDPDLLILDEPTNGLDPKGMKEVRELILRLNQDHGKTIFLSSHLLYEMEMVATRMAIIHRGDLIIQGMVRELLDERNVTLRINAEPVAKATALLQSLQGVSDVIVEQNIIHCSVQNRPLSEINAALVNN
ncbi:MAG: ABC transporter ATP-binding protein, partial [Chlorobi bacterium]|nr:ABC transporter ATP-binding protein [Chlorobiota bacterium]